MTTVDELLCVGWPHRMGVTIAGLWCLLSPPFVYVICGANWVLLWCGVKPITRYVGSGVSCKEGVLVQAQGSCHLVGATK